MKKQENLCKSLYLNNQITLLNKNNFFQLEKDKEAIVYYEKFVKDNFFFKDNKSHLSRIKWLINNKYYQSIPFEKFTDDETQEIINVVVSTKFNWNSYISIKKFYESYCLKTDCGDFFLEKYEDRIIASCIFLSDGNFEVAKKLAYALIKQIYQPATPTFANSAKKRSGELVSCFLLEADDSLNSINYIISTSMQLSKLGGGVAINLSKLRAKGSAIKNIALAGSGIIPVLKILENVFDYADQLGMRRGSGAAYLNIFHKDLIDFLDCKKINADEKSRIQTLSTGIIMPDKFIQLAKENKEFFVFEPHSIFKKYNVHLAEINMAEWYEKLILDKDIIKESYSPRNILNKIAQTQFESGYPYIMFIDNANRQNPLKEIGKIKMSNLCTEIFQIQETSIINDYNIEDQIKYDVSCTLGSLNLVNLMENGDFKNIIYVAMESLTKVTDYSNIENAPGVSKANKELRSVGLGVMNLCGLFIKHQIPYESKLCLEIVDVLFAAINYYSILASCKIAKYKKQSFKNFEKSEYANGNYFEKYLKNDFLPKTDKVKEIFKNIELPNINDWKKLKDKVKKDGLFHAYRLAVAPTQSISYLHGATSSCQPIIDKIETRMYGESVTYFPMPFLSQENQFLFKSAYHINQFKIIDLISVIQKHVDQGISTILYVTNENTTRDLVKLYLYAHHKGLKSIYYTRTKNLEMETCVSCEA